MDNLEVELRARVDAFISDLSSIIHRRVLEAVSEALKQGAPAAAPAPVKKVGRPAKVKAVAKPAPVKSAAKPAAPAPKPVAPAAAQSKFGEKRSPQQLAQITQQVHGYIKSNPGQGVEQIAKALQTSTKELTLPIRKLLASKKISSKGQRRATRYSSK